MKLGRITTGVLAATIAVGSLTAPQANATPVYQTNDVIASSWDSGIGGAIQAVVIGSLMFLSLSSPGCHMMNTPACHAPNA